MRERIITEGFIQKFHEHMLKEEKSNATIEKYLRDIRRFMAFANGNKVTKDMALGYKEELGSSYAHVSANSMITAVNTFFKFAKWDDCCVKCFKIQKKHIILKTKN